MLTTLKLKNFFFIDELALDFNGGMTVLTGETGAGKSILCDALWLVLGNTANKSVIQPGKSNCRLEACFDISHSPSIQQWMKEQEYMDHNTTELEPVFCYMTRIIDQKGRGQLWINHKSAKLKDLQWLRAHLVARHSQHDQQRLLTHDYQRELLDRYGQYRALTASTESCYIQYISLKKQYESLLSKTKEQAHQLNFLAYQLEELEKVKVKPNELQDLNKRQRQLSNAHQILEKGQEALILISELEPVHLTKMLQSVHSLVQKMAHLDDRFTSVSHALERAHLEMNEAETTLRYVLSEVTIDPGALHEVDERLLELHNLGKKYKVDIEKLPDLAKELKKEYAQYEKNKQALINCEKALEMCLQRYDKFASQLTQEREKASVQLAEAVTKNIQSLGMLGGRFSIQLKSLTDKKFSRFGKEQVIFHLSAAPGQRLETLGKGASGGELSRLSLVIQALMAETTMIPTFIFDEIDVGVGGGIAERMGRLLQILGQSKQILCITHLPQVAVLAKHHYCIKRHTQDDATVTQVTVLNNEEERVQEIARMLGGIHITEKTIAYAKSMLMVERTR